MSLFGKIRWALITNNYYFPQGKIRKRVSISQEKEETYLITPTRKGYPIIEDSSEPGTHWIVQENK